MLELVQNHPLQFRPGTASSYNSSGYLLLGLIIESVTGEEFGQVLEDIGAYRAPWQNGGVRDVAVEPSEAA